MKHKLHSLKRPIFYLLPIIVLGFIWFFRPTNRESKNLNLEDYHSLQKVKAILEKNYQDPVLSAAFWKAAPTCFGVDFDPNEVHPSYFQCNSFLFNCFLSNQIPEFSFNQILEKHPEINSSVKIEAHPLALVELPYIVHAQETDNSAFLDEGLVINIRLENQVWPLFLKKNCHQAILPQGKYRTINSTENILWDTKNLSIEIDKQLVTKGDYWIYRRHQGNEAKLQNPHFPANVLSRKKHQEFCQWRYRAPLTTLVFDAASIPPKVWDNPLSDYPDYSKFPFIHQRLNFSDNLETCPRFYHKGCLSTKKFTYHDTHSTTWMGLNEVQGGVIEILENPLDTEAIYYPSSKFLNADSSFHELGTRLNQDDLLTLTDASMEELEFGFRCMRKYE